MQRAVVQNENKISATAHPHHAYTDVVIITPAEKPQTTRPPLTRTRRHLPSMHSTQISRYACGLLKCLTRHSDTILFSLVFTGTLNKHMCPAQCDHDGSAS